MKTIFAEYEDAKADDPELKVSIYWEASRRPSTPTSRSLSPLPNRPPLKLRGTLFGRLHEAILNAFDRNTLNEVLLFQMGTSLGQIVGDGGLSYQAMEVMNYFDRTGQLGDLVLAVRQANPGNAKLATFAQEIGY